MKILPFSETLAHQGDLLADHLLRVAKEADISLGTASESLRMMSVLSGLCHDLGKATFYFQEWRLKNGKKEQLTHHSQLSALIFWWFSQGLECDDQTECFRIRLGGFVSVLRHHGNLKENWFDTLVRVRHGAKDSRILPRQLRSVDLDGMITWLSEQSSAFGIPWKPFSDMPVSPEDILDAIQKPNKIKLKKSMPRNSPDALRDMTAFLAGFGAILGADKIDTALGGERVTRAELLPNMVAEYKQRVFGGAGGEINDIRKNIASEVMTNLTNHSDAHHFTLTAPTGTGKTLTALDAVLALRSRLTEQNKSAGRIIYCLPFTSVIDQNHQVFSEVLKSGGLPDTQDILLKHHHLTDTFYRTARENESDADGAGQLLTESWQSEIVVTTFHQFLHTFFTGRNRNLKRAAQLAGSIVILDEVQAVPLRYWLAIRNLFLAVAESLDTRFILMTATRPLIYEPGKDAVELLNSHEKYFALLSRIHVECHHRDLTGLSEFAEKICSLYEAEPSPTLVIVNRRAAVKKIFEMIKTRFPKIPKHALSTDFTPLDRRKKIKDIRELLDDHLPVIVVSTQMVEAGVDISFPVVHRDLAPLDAVIQSAGRCNRHNGAEKGILHLWCLYDDTQERMEQQWQKVYDRCLIDATTEAVGDREVIAEKEFLELTDFYFKICRSRDIQIPVDEYLSEGNFEKVDRVFHLIEEGPPTISVFVIQNECDESLWERYLSLDDIESPFERQKEFLMFKFPFFERVVQVYGQGAYEYPIICIRPEHGFYNSETGFVALPEEESVV